MAIKLSEIEKTTLLNDKDLMVVSHKDTATDRYYSNSIEYSSVKTQIENVIKDKLKEYVCPSSEGSITEETFKLSRLTITYKNKSDGTEEVFILKKIR